jgi:hypothetical protein
VDLLFASLDERLQTALPSFEARVIQEVLRIPPHVLLSSEMRGEEAGRQANKASSTAEEEAQEKKLEGELAALQRRVAAAAKLNRALRTECQYTRTQSGG